MSDKKKEVDLGVVLAIIAVIISICTMIISLVETSIMQKQQHSMTESAKASVWPYVTTTINTLADEGQIKFSFELENKGVGPALMKDFEMQYDGKKIEKSILEVLKIHCPDAIAINISTHKINSSILSAGEKKQVVGLTIIESDFLNFAEFTKLISSNYCFTNIYGDSWRSTNNDPKACKTC